MSGLELLGAIASSIAVVQAVQGIAKTINMLRGICEIQRQCDDLMLEIRTIETFILEIEKASLPTSHDSRTGIAEEHPLIVPVAMQLTEIVGDLNDLLKRCTDGTNDPKRKIKKLRWLREQNEIKALQKKAHNTKWNLHLAIGLRTWLTLQDFDRRQEEALPFLSAGPRQIDAPKAGESAETSPSTSVPNEVIDGGPTIGLSSGPKMQEDDDANNPFETSTEIVRTAEPQSLSLSKSPSRYTAPEQMESLVHVRAIQPLDTQVCSGECQCRCHWGRREYRGCGWLQPLVGSWLVNVRHIGGGLGRQICNEKECRRGTGTAMELKYQLPKWLWSGMLSFQASYNGQPDFSCSLRPIGTCRDSDVFIYFDTPGKLRRKIEAGFKCFPDDCTETGELLLEFILTLGLLPSVRLLLGLWENVLQKQGLPSTIGHKINATLTTSHCGMKKSDVDLLQRMKSFVDGGFGERTTKLHDAVRQGDKDRVQQVIRELSWAINELDDCRQSPIHTAVQCNRPEALRQLIEAGADVSLRDSFSHTPLILAARFDRLECIQLLLETEKHRRYVNHQDNWGNTALHVAARFCSPSAVAMLLAAGASVTKRNNWGVMPLSHLAANKNQHAADEIVRLFRSNQADLNAPDQTGVTAVLVSVQENDVPVLRALVKAGASLHSVTKDSFNILHFVLVYHSDVEMLHYLDCVELTGVDPDLRNADGLTPWDVFCLKLRKEYWDSPDFIDYPSSAQRDAFLQLFFGVVSRSCQNDVDALNSLLQAFQQKDVTTSCKELATIIDQKEMRHRHDLVTWYRGICGYVKVGNWHSAIEHIQSDLDDISHKLAYAQDVLDGFLDPISWIHDKFDEGSDGESYSTDGEIFETNEGEDSFSQSGDGGLGEEKTTRPAHEIKNARLLEGEII